MQTEWTMYWCFMVCLWTTWIGLDGKGTTQCQACLKFLGGDPVLQLDAVTSYLKQDGHTRNGNVILRSYVVQSAPVDSMSVHRPGLYVAHLFCSQTDIIRLHYIFCAPLFCPNMFETKILVQKRLATCFYTVIKVCTRVAVSSTWF